MGIVIGIAVGIVLLSLFAFLSNRYSNKKMQEREVIERQHRYQEEQHKWNALAERFKVNPVFQNIMQKIHAEFGSIMNDARCKPLSKKDKHFYTINIFSDSIKTGDHIITELDLGHSLVPNRSSFLFSSYNMENLKRDYIYAFVKAIMADMKSCYSLPNISEEKPFHGIDGDYDYEGLIMIVIELTAIHPKHDEW